MSNKIKEMLKQALNEGVTDCPKCGTHLEPDYDTCRECEKDNPLKKLGLI